MKTKTEITPIQHVSAFSPYKMKATNFSLQTGLQTKISVSHLSLFQSLYMLSGQKHWLFKPKKQVVYNPLYL